MKNAIESTIVEPAEPEFGNRKLIRPILPRPEHRERDPERRERASATRKAPPPEQTHAENFYYQKQMQSKTPMVIVLQDGENVNGVIEWYDRHCLKVVRNGGPNMIIYKQAIRYMYKQSERMTNG